MRKKSCSVFLTECIIPFHWRTKKGNKWNYGWMFKKYSDKNLNGQ